MDNAAFIVFPTIELDQYILRSISIADTIDLYNYLSQVVVSKYYDLEVFKNEKEVKDLISYLSYRYSTGEQLRWGIVNKDNNVLVGTCGFHGFEREHSKVEMGYDLHPDYWGKGIMTKVIEAIVDYGFSQMKVNRIEAFWHPDNIGSKRVLEKNGFIHEGILKSRFHKKNTYIDACLSAKIKGMERKKIIL